MRMNVSFPSPPMDLKKWSMEILDELIKYPGVESEKFDFKGNQMGDLAQHICAMANTHGGILVLGIGQNTHNGRLQFVKEGWEKGKEDEANKTVSHHVYQVEPVPSVTPQAIYDKEDKFFMVLSIEPKIKDRPYTIKGKGLCYIRVGNVSPPATRDTILSLCKQTINRFEEIQMLHAVTSVLKEQSLHVDNKGREIQNRAETPYFYIPRIELDSFRQSASRSIWFMSENDLLAGRLVSGPDRRHGLYAAINHLQELDSAINTFNLRNEVAVHRNASFIGYYSGWRSLHLQWILEYLDRVIVAANKFLENQT